MNDIWSKPKTRWGLLIGAFLVGCALTGSILTRPTFADNSPSRPSRISAAELAQRTTGLAALEDGFVAIGERVLPTVVSIRARRTIDVGGDVPDVEDFFRDFGLPGPRLRIPRQFRTEGGGSGAIVRSDGWIITNDHVVGGADKVTVKLEDGREFEGTVRRDFRSDIAVVKIDAKDLPTIEFADSSRVRVGQWALAFGAPLSLDDTMTLGIISARKRQQTIGSGNETRFYPELIQTDASINPGNSGGPLVNIDGKVIGINVAIASPTGGNVGIGFAIPSNSAKRVMDALITKGKVVRGYLGIIPAALTPDQRTKYGVPKGGALVETVSEDTPAAKAGLQVEDVILKINGTSVEDDIHLRNLIAELTPGQTVEIVVRRDGKDRTIKATIGEAPDLLAQAESPAGNSVAKVGLKVEAITPENARRYGLGDLREGVVVTEVQTGSAAEDAGLEPGDVILRADRQAVNSPAALDHVLTSARKGSTVSLVVQRERARVLVRLRIP